VCVCQRERKSARLEGLLKTKINYQIKIVDVALIFVVVVCVCVHVCEILLLSF